MLSRQEDASSTPESAPRTRGFPRGRKSSRAAGGPSATVQGVACRLRLILPQNSWLGQITRLHPKEQVDFASRSDLGDGLRLVMLRLHSNEPDAWMTDLSRLPQAVEVSGMRLASNLTNVHIIHKGVGLVPLFAKADLMWELPFPVRNGEAICEVVGTYATVHQFVEEFRALSLKIVVDGAKKQGIDHFRDVAGPLKVTGRVLITNPLEGLYSRTAIFQAPLSAPELPKTKGGPATTGHLTVCRLRLALPPKMWVSLFSRKFPEASVSVVGQLVADQERTLVDLKVHSANPQDWAATIISLPEVLAVDKLGSAGYTSTLRVTFKTHPLYELFNKLSLMWRLPAPVRDGMITIAMVGSDESVRQMIDTWRGHHLEVKVESVRHTEEESKALLTPRQEYIFRKALVSGYYDVPRRVTLSELSRTVGVAVSSLSEILAIAEKKMLNKADNSR